MSDRSTSPAEDRAARIKERAARPATAGSKRSSTSRTIFSVGRHMLSLSSNIRQPHYDDRGRAFAGGSAKKLAFVGKVHALQRTLASAQKQIQVLERDSSSILMTSGDAWSEAAPDSNAHESASPAAPLPPSPLPPPSSDPLVFKSLTTLREHVAAMERTLTQLLHQPLLAEVVQPSSARKHFGESISVSESVSGQGAAQVAAQGTAGTLAQRGEVLILGLEGAGKTLLCRHLERMTAMALEGGMPSARGRRTGSKAAVALPPLDAAIQPSIGIELLELRHGNTAFTVREIGGSMQPVWHRYYANSAAVLFCVDSDDPQATAGSTVEICEILTQLQDRRVCLFVNKRDVAAALPRDSLDVLMGIPDLVEFAGDDRLRVIAGSALTGEGLTEALDWCTASLHERAELEALIAAKEAKDAAAVAKAKAAEEKANADAAAGGPPAGPPAGFAGG